MSRSTYKLLRLEDSDHCSVVHVPMTENEDIGRLENNTKLFILPLVAQQYNLNLGDVR